MGYISTQVLREKRRRRIRARIAGTPSRPRLSIFRSNTHLSAQIIDDTKGHTLATVSSREDTKKAMSLERATALGKTLATRAKVAGVSTVVFDRGGYSYAGKVKALAEGARAGGLKF